MVEHRIVLTGGGTGGHVYPALAVAEELKQWQDVKAILYIGAQGHLEERLAKEGGLEFIGLSVAGLPRRVSPKLFTWPFRTMFAVDRALKVFREFAPTAVLGTGGYASAPPLAAAALRHIPYIIHEPDAHPGLVNRIFAKGAHIVSCGMESAGEKLATRGQTFINGNPIRRSFLRLPSREEAARSFQLKPELKTLLITGGSQGAAAINQAVVEALPDILSQVKDVQVVHQVGDKNFDDFKSTLPASLCAETRYQIRPYIDDLAVAYAFSDLTIARAGAMTISELGVTGTPAIFIPYPFAAQNHQEFNARYVESQGAATMILQSELTGERLCKTVLDLLQDETKLQTMREHMARLGRPSAAANIANQLRALSADFQKTGAA
ncbi:MAG TPA: undecaprenyldiphospho-muramoylpentapeptide beta-N-acetylglucosaminyltransferase [Candidatus Obscuribacterales bacterium]